MVRRTDKMSPFAPVDHVLDQFGLPEIEPLLKEISPKKAARGWEFPTLDDMSQEALADFREARRKFERGEIPEPPQPEDFFGGR